MKTEVFSILKKFDFTFFGTITSIFIIGILNLYSATHSHSYSHISNLYLSQILWFVTAFAVGVGVSFIDSKNLFRYTYFFYAINILLLVAVLVMGDVAMGGRRWLILGPLRLQPSEPMKIVLVLTLSRWFSQVNPLKELTLRDLFFPFLLALLPALLIIVQPDLGTGGVHILIFFMMAFYRKLKIKSILILFVLGAFTGTLMYKYALKEYQRKRIITFLNPGSDAKGSGYNAIQSEIAIGSGQFFGKGFRNSSQASLNYLPENHTDFAFSLFNEEHGLFGSLVLISLYVILLIRFIWLSQSVSKFYDSVVAIGIMSIFFWHTFINMCMVMGLMPIVGIPLPLVSYGGSGLMLFMISAGIATSISNSRTMF